MYKPEKIHAMCVYLGIKVTRITRKWTIIAHKIDGLHRQAQQNIYGQAAHGQRQQAGRR